MPNTPLIEDTFCPIERMGGHNWAEPRPVSASHTRTQLEVQTGFLLPCQESGCGQLGCEMSGLPHTRQGDGMQGDGAQDQNYAMSSIVLW